MDTAGISDLPDTTLLSFRFWPRAYYAVFYRLRANLLKYRREYSLDGGPTEKTLFVRVC